MEKVEEKNKKELAVHDDLAVAIDFSGPRTWDLEQLNLAIGGINDASAVVAKIGDLVKSLEGFRQQISSPAATPRQATLLQSEAITVSDELNRALVDAALLPFGASEDPHIPSDGLPEPQQLKAIESVSNTLRANIEEKRGELHRELARLETAHLNSESSHSAVRDIESALALVLNTRESLLTKPARAVDACGALGVRARALLMAG